MSDCYQIWLSLYELPKFEIYKIIKVLYLKLRGYRVQGALHVHLA